MSLMDRLAVAASVVAGDSAGLETSVVKATRQEDAPDGPKEKHVRALILATNDGGVSMTDLIGAVMLRCTNANWNVVLKTLMLTHRLMRDGNTRFIDELKFRPKVFDLDHFNDPSSADGVHNSAFVRKYAQYLEEKVNVYKSVKVEFDKKPNSCKNLTTDDMFVKLPKLQSLVNALLNCRVQRADLNHPLVMHAFQYLLKDSFALYSCLSDGMINLIERFFEMQKSDALRAFDIYKLYTKETDGIIGLYDMCRGFANNIPDVDKPPAGLDVAMEEHLNELKGGGTPKKAAAAGDGKKKEDVKQDAGKAAAAKMSTPVASANLFDVNFDAAPSAAATSSATPAPAAAASLDPFASLFGGPIASTPTPAVAAGAVGGAAPTTTTPIFDPFSTPAPAAAPSQLGVDDKLMRILAVNQLAAQQQPIAAAPLQPLTPTPVAAAPAPVFNPFPQQPLTAAPLFGAPAQPTQPLMQGSFNAFGQATPAAQPQGFAAFGAPAAPAAAAANNNNAFAANPFF